jgi:hypothetical protein
MLIAGVYISLVASCWEYYVHLLSPYSITSEYDDVCR